LPPLSAKTVKYYQQFYAVSVATIIVFGALLSPMLELKLGLGGQCCLVVFDKQQCKYMPQLHYTYIKATACRSIATCYISCCAVAGQSIELSAS
jgi:hypothetical protein